MLDHRFLMQNVVYEIMTESFEIAITLNQNWQFCETTNEVLFTRCIDVNVKTCRNVYKMNHRFGYFFYFTICLH